MHINSIEFSLMYSFSTSIQFYVLEKLEPGQTFLKLQAATLPSNLWVRNILIFWNKWYLERFLKFFFNSRLGEARKLKISPLRKCLMELPRPPQSTRWLRCWKESRSSHFHDCIGFGLLTARKSDFIVKLRRCWWCWRRLSPPGQGWGGLLQSRHRHPTFTQSRVTRSCNNIWIEVKMSQRCVWEIDSYYA